MANDFMDRVDERLKATGLTDRAASMLATEDRNPDLIRNLRTRGGKPRPLTLDKLAEVLETTTAYLLYGREAPAAATALKDRRTGYEAGDESPVPLPRNLPVYGTALGSRLDFDREDAIETHMIELTDAIDWVRRPPLLQGRRDVYALYIAGSSMEPRFEPGDPVIVDPKRPPAPGDYVIVQIGNGEQIVAALIKRLIRRTARFVELLQFNPEMRFQVPVERIASIHRVYTMRDLLT